PAAGEAAVHQGGAEPEVRRGDAGDGHRPWRRGPGHRVHADRTGQTIGPRGRTGAAGAQHAAPLRAFGGVCIPVTANPTATHRILPGLRLPLGRRRIAPGAAVSLLLHAALIVFLVVRGRELLDRRARTTGWPGGGGGGGAGRPEVNFFALPARSAPSAVELPEPPHVAVADLSG